jgi:hypothetical protein
MRLRLREVDRCDGGGKLTVVGLVGPEVNTRSCWKNTINVMASKNSIVHAELQREVALQHFAGKCICPCFSSLRKAFPQMGACYGISLNPPNA